MDPFLQSNAIFQWSSHGAKTKMKIQLKSKYFYIILIVSVVLVVFSLLSIYETYSEGGHGLDGMAGRRMAIVYANPTYHDEVASVVSCILHDLGFYVVVYIGNGVQMGGGLMLPFSGKRRRSSSEFYGRCVSQWVTISTSMMYVHNPDIIVFVTAPMFEHNFKLDQHAIGWLQHLQEEKSATSVVYLTHRTNEMISNTLPIYESYIPRNQSTFMFLGEHTHKDARRFLEENRNLYVGSPESFHIAHFYPVVPLEYITKNARTYLDQAYQPKFAMQGNFGGKHAHRKDPAGVVHCLKALEGRTVKVAQDHRAQGEQYSAAFIASSDNSTTKGQSAIIQSANFTRFRRRLASNSTGSSKHHQQPEEQKITVSLDLIGHLQGELNLGSFHTGEIRFLSGLKSTDYYAAISKAKFMLAGIAEKEYLTSRATSSVPAGIIARVPLVLNRELLAIYPCLRESRIHKMISKETECESIEAALMLSREEYEEAKNEVRHCGEWMYQEAQNTFQKLVSRK